MPRGTMLVADDVALDLLRALRPVVAQLRRYSPEAADQVDRAASRIVLHLAAMAAIPGVLKRSRPLPSSVRKRSRTFAVASIPPCQVTPTGPLSRLGRVYSRASAGGSVFDDTCSKIFAMCSRISACRASGSSPTGSGGPYTQ